MIGIIFPILGGMIGVLIVACLLYCIDENKEINKQ
jgi:uncharacterized membrane protein